jgi:hypothetical protein
MLTLQPHQRLSAHLIQVQLSTNPILPLLCSLLEILQWTRVVYNKTLWDQPLRPELF